MSDTTKPALYALNPQEHATIQAALACYFDRVDDAFADQIYTETATKGGTVKAMDAKQVESLAKRLNGPGLEFVEIVNLIGDDPDDPYVRGAHTHYLLDEGTLEVDHRTIVSRGDDPGAYVMAWLWVSNEQAGVEDEDEDEETEAQQ
jgi:hypothetical protein